MSAKTLAEHARAYLDLQGFLDECLVDGRDTEPASRAVEQARRDLLDRLDGSQGSDFRPLAEAIRTYLDAEHQFDKCSAAGVGLDAAARRMEAARRDLEQELQAVTREHVQETQPRRVPSQPPPTPMPPRQRRLLVAYDESLPARYALEVAIKMAQETGGKIMLLHVARPAATADRDWLDALHHRKAEEMLAKVRQQLPPSVQAAQLVVEGAPIAEIVTTAQVWEADLVLMGTRARGRLAQFLLGSTTEAVIRRAPCPVIAVGRRAAWASEGWPVERYEAIVRAER
jgi:nucleotide-binding universal stress UspA family protein